MAIKKKEESWPMFFLHSSEFEWGFKRSMHIYDEGRLIKRRYTHMNNIPIYVYLHSTGKLHWDIKATLSVYIERAVKNVYHL